nr:MAG TPA: Troponin I, fast skeletal muscle, actin, tropomyosin, CONTRACTILE PROTEIN [Caudoviricetes sp.]
MEFLKEFEERIPASSFKDSGLWRKNVEDKVEKLRAEILLG